MPGSSDTIARLESPEPTRWKFTRAVEAESARIAGAGGRSANKSISEAPRARISAARRAAVRAGAFARTHPGAEIEHQRMDPAVTGRARPHHVQSRDRQRQGSERRHLEPEQRVDPKV